MNNFDIDCAFALNGRRSGRRPLSADDLTFPLRTLHYPLRWDGSTPGR